MLTRRYLQNFVEIFSHFFHRKVEWNMIQKRVRKVMKMKKMMRICLHQIHITKNILIQILTGKQLFRLQDILPCLDLHFWFFIFEIQYELLDSKTWQLIFHSNYFIHFVSMWYSDFSIQSTCNIQKYGLQFSVVYYEDLKL